MNCWQVGQRLGRQFGQRRVKERLVSSKSLADAVAVNSMPQLSQWVRNVNICDATPSFLLCGCVAIKTYDWPRRMMVVPMAVTVAIQSRRALVD